MSTRLSQTLVRPLPDDAIVIFDCDGVLVDSETVACETEATLLTQLGYPITSREIGTRFLGVEKKVIKEIIYKESGVALPEKYPQILHQKVMSRLAQGLNSIHHVQDVFEYTSRKCIASGAPIDRIELVLRTAGLWGQFSVQDIFSADMVSRPKPAPDLHLYILAKKQTVADRCVVIEDSPIGVQAANQAGIKALGFTGASHASGDAYKRTLLEAGAFAIFDDMRDLPRLLSMIYHQEKE